MKLPYLEGSAFLVPLPSGGYGRGLIARAAPKGKILLGYFFGPRLEQMAEPSFDRLETSDAILRVRFGDLGLIEGHWPIVGNVPNWKRSEWPMPDFVRRDPLGKLKPKLVRYADDDPSQPIGEHPVDDDAGLATDSLSGYRAIEAKLDRLLGAGPQGVLTN